MAITVSFDGGRVNAADAVGTVWTDLGGGKCAVEPDFIYQGTAAISEKVGTSEDGVALNMGATTVSYSTGPKVWLAKCVATNSSALNNKGATGGILEIGSGGRRSAYDRYYVVGKDTYPLRGGWLFIPIDPNGGNQSARPGAAPNLGAINYYGWACTFSATSKAENVALDAVDWITNGTGLTLVGTTPDGKFSDFVAFDEDTARNNRYGIVSTRDGIIYVTGVITIGTATLTTFNDTGRVIVFPDAEFLNSVGFFGLNIGLQNASSAVTITDCVLKGRGTVGGTVDTRPDYICTGTSGTATYSGCTFDTFREFTMSSGLTVDGCSFLNGDKVTQAGGTITNCLFTGSTAGDGDGYLDANGNVSGCDFEFSDGHAIEWVGAATASMNITNCNFSGGYGAAGGTDAVFYNPNTSGTLTLNLSNVTGDTFTVRTASGGTTQVNNNVTVTFDKMKDNTEVRIYAAGTSTELDGIENATAGTTDNRNFAASVAGSTSVDYWIFNVNYVPIVVKAFTWPSTAQTINVQQIIDRNYSNP